MTVCVILMYKCLCLNDCVCLFSLLYGSRPGPWHRPCKRSCCWSWVVLPWCLLCCWFHPGNVPVCRSLRLRPSVETCRPSSSPYLWGHVPLGLHNNPCPFVGTVALGHVLVEKEAPVSDPGQNHTNGEIAESDQSFPYLQHTRQYGKHKVNRLVLWKEKTTASQKKRKRKREKTTITQAKSTCYIKL